MARGAPAMGRSLLYICTVFSTQEYCHAPHRTTGGRAQLRTDRRPLVDLEIRPCLKAIEPAPATLSIDGFIIWGPVLYEKHSAEDPVQLAARLFGSSGPYFRYLYPGAAAAANQG